MTYVATCLSYMRGQESNQIHTIVERRDVQCSKPVILLQVDEFGMVVQNYLCTTIIKYIT